MNHKQILDYLLPLQPRILSLANNEWKQNPGW